jgi:Cu/Zn superoxide dismutase
VKRKLFIWLIATALLIFLLPYSSAQKSFTFEMKNAQGYSLFTEGGTSLVIHAKPDDMKTDPSGDSVDRIVCGVISK